jgi:DNA-binding MarR family transcriptional regulator
MTNSASGPDRRTLDGVLTLLRMVRALERVDAGITPQQYRILKLIEAGGERSARLAERLAVAKPTLTAIADGLVAAGLAQREAEPGDRRVVRLCLTKAGTAAVARADAAYAGWLQGVLADTGDAADVLASMSLLDQTMDERRRAAHRPAAGDNRPAAATRAKESGSAVSLHVPAKRQRGTGGSDIGTHQARGGAQ